jgi:hypothetical protein
MKSHCEPSPLPEGANPTKFRRLTLEEVRTHRNQECHNYDGCLVYAGTAKNKGGWVGFHCMYCKFFEVK